MWQDCSSSKSQCASKSAFCFTWLHWQVIVQDYKCLERVSSYYAARELLMMTTLWSLVLVRGWQIHFMFNTDSCLLKHLAVSFRTTSCRGLHGSLNGQHPAFYRKVSGVDYWNFCCKHRKILINAPRHLLEQCPEPPAFIYLVIYLVWPHQFREEDVTNGTWRTVSSWRSPSPLFVFFPKPF